MNLLYPSSLENIKLLYKKPHGLKGKPKSLKTCEKMRQVNLGKKRSQETCENMSKSRLKRKSELGYINSPKTKEKIRQSHLGKKATSETKEKQRQAKLGNIPSPKAGRGIKTHYQSPFQGEVCFRSSYELKYAQYLDSIGEIWFYEAGYLEMNINGKDTTYTPDFSLPLRREFVEIKGWMRPLSKLKCEKFKEELEDPELIGIFGYKVLFKDDLQNCDRN